MSLRILSDVIQGSDDWHDQRRGMITASVVGRLVSSRQPGASSYPCPECNAFAYSPCVSRARKDAAPIKTHHPARIAAAATGTLPRVIEPADGDDVRNLTLLLAAERITGWTDPTYVTDDMLRGVEDEPRAVEVYAGNYAPVQTCGFMRLDESWGTLGFSPDGLVGEEGLIEVKSRRGKKQLATILADEVPPENLAQCQAGLLVSGRKWLDYVSFCGGMPLYRKRVYPDQRWFDAIIAAVSRFEETVDEMVRIYQSRVASLPMTERSDDLEMVI